MKRFRLIWSVCFFFIATNALALQSQAQQQEVAAASVDELLEPITPEENSLLEKRMQDQKKYANVPNFVSLYKSNYLLPYYFTASPYRAAYVDNTPNHQDLMQSEFKGQFSVDVPIVQNVFEDPNLSIHGTYTQLVYWQFYASSQYFRETDYEPSVMVSYHLYKNWVINGGVVHQSNGRGGAYERSWNRAFGAVQFSGAKWFAGLEAWGLIFQGESSDLHNPDIERYLGHERITLGYKPWRELVLTLEIQNIEGGFGRGHVMASASYPLNNKINAMAQYFNGYGQSLIEYDHYTQAFGLGISFNRLL